MKYLWIVLLFAFTLVSYAEDITIPEEAMPTITKARPVRLAIDMGIKRGVIGVHKGYINESGVFVPVKEENITFTNIDDPDTERNEEDFQDLLDCVDKTKLRNLITERLGE